MNEVGAETRHNRSVGESHGKPTATRAQNMQQFVHILHRYIQLGRSFNAAGQRERSALQYPLMQLYVELYPKSGFKMNDDFDVAMRAILQQMKRTMAQTIAA